MPALSHQKTSSPSMSPRLPQEQKWTVSPEFGDALMNAMRERTESGGPIPRLPSLLQLPGSDTVSKPAAAPEVNPDNAKLTMKTRVAVRDKTPHRFQVVPLREIGSLALPAQDTTPLSRAPRSALRAARLNIYSSNTSRVLDSNENSAPTIPHLEERKPGITPGRHELAQTVLEIKGDISVSERLGPSPHDQPSNPMVSSPPDEQHTPACRTPPPLEIVQPHPIATHRSSMPARSILRSRNTNEHDYSHSKSPSLGNLQEKPPLSKEPDYATLPRVGCRKRTNTLSVDSPAFLRGDRAIYEETKILERRRPLEHNALKRHAIYTQSLYVPHNEHGFLPGGKPLVINSKRPPFLDPIEDASDLTPRQRRASRSSVQSSRSTPRAARQAKSLSGVLVSDDALQISRPIFPSSSARDFSSDSYSSISSIYSQDGLSLNSRSSQATLTQTRPLSSRFSSDYMRRQTKEFRKGEIVHHPIVADLLAQVDKALEEWRSI